MPSILQGAFRAALNLYAARANGPADNPFDLCAPLSNDCVPESLLRVDPARRASIERNCMPRTIVTVEERLRRVLGSRLLTQEPMRHHTSLRIGGPADFYFAAVTTDELVAALRTGRDLGVPVFLLGGGCNLLVSDEGFRGLVIRNACEQIQFDGSAVHVECGADFTDMIFRCRDHGVAGLEFADGIPVSVVGAIYGNAGCYGEDIGQFTVECTIASMDGSRVETLPAAWFEFGYRDSRLKREPRVLLSCLLKLRHGDPVESQKIIDEKLEIRRVKHPQWRVEPTAGSYFKNLPPDWRMPGAKLSPGTHRVAAGQLLDECGCRGLRVGEAMVYEKHANIIVNGGRATAREVLELAAEMKRRVRERFDVELEEEVMFLGERPKLAVVRV